MSKIEEFMAKQGKSLKPVKPKKDGKKLSKKEIDELVMQMLKDFGYVE